jgi:hypothetical protein
MKYLTLIRAVALLHQYQRPRKTRLSRGKTFEYIEVTLDDIGIANQLTEEVLGRSLDELPPQTRRLLSLIEEMVRGECQRQKMERSDFRFSRRDVRAFAQWGDTQLKTHLRRLEELEYLLVHHGGRGQSFVYELQFESKENNRKPFFPGLIDVKKLETCTYDEKKAGVEDEKSGFGGEKSGSSRPQVGGMSGGGRGEESPALARRNGDFRRNPEKRTTRDTRENRVAGIAAKVQ